MLEISSSPLLSGSPQHIYLSLFHTCKWEESLSLPLSILQIHAHCGVLRLAATEDDSISMIAASNKNRVQATTQP